MNFQKLTPQSTYIVSIAPNEDIVAVLTDFIKEHEIASGYFFGLGAVKSVRLAHYSVSTKKYLEHKIKKPLEMVNITGIITKDKAHVHGIFGNQLFRGYGGHIVRAVVAAACEIILVETAEKITRRHSEEVGLELLDL